MSELTFCDALKSSRAYSLIRNDFTSGLGHAYMIVSGDVEIVDEFFTLVAMGVYCQSHSACFECNECKKVLHDNNPDIYHLYPDSKDKIRVNDVSDILEDVSIKSLSGRKLYFIHRADCMNVASQNKLLKTLEEPPQDVTIFLGVSNEASMLDTIKSRTRTIAMDVFDEDVIYDVLTSQGFDKDICAIASACAEGQLGKARKIAGSQDYADLYKTALHVLKELARSSDIVKVDGLISQEHNLSQLLDVMSIILRDMLVIKQNPSLMLSKHVSQDVQSLSERYSARALAEIFFKISEARRKLSLNVNTVATIDNLLFSILEAKHKWQ